MVGLRRLAVTALDSREAFRTYPEGNPGAGSAYLGIGLPIGRQNPARRPRYCQLLLHYPPPCCQNAMFGCWKVGGGTTP